MKDEKIKRKRRKTTIARHRMYAPTLQRLSKIIEDSKLKSADFFEKLVEEMESKKQGRLL